MLITFTNFTTVSNTLQYPPISAYFPQDSANPSEIRWIACSSSSIAKAFKAHLLPDDWIDNNDETVWNFYVDILEKHKEELL